MSLADPDSMGLSDHLVSLADLDSMGLSDHLVLLDYSVYPVS